MNQPIKAKLPGKPRILVAPLDWGLGHATRCIPIIRLLIAEDFDVWLCGENAQEELLTTEFPALPFLKLRGYHVKYSKTKRGLFWKMILQLPKLKKVIRYENKWLENIVQEYGIDAVISDNRYGLYHTSIPCIFITHQLNIKSSIGKWSEKILQKINYRYINRFTECWIPDLESKNNFAGELSHPELKPTIPLHYIGILSRFEKKETDEKKDHLVVIISGPEPQRSIFEDLIIQHISHYNGTATIVRGLPGSANIIPSTNMIKFYNHLPAEDLNKEMLEAEYIISRSGYSSIMDIMLLKKKSILIPTPGQTEQEYLGNYLTNNHLAICIQQKDFDLESSLKKAAAFNFQLPDILPASELHENIKRRIGKLL